MGQAPVVTRNTQYSGSTDDTYSHVNAGLQDESLAHLDALFAGG